MKKLGFILVLLVLLIAGFFVVVKNIENKPAFSFEEATIDSVQIAIKTHQITCEQLVNAYINRIEKYNLSVNRKPPINAIARINLNVVDQARKLDQDFRNGQTMGPLFCIPVLLKDNIDSYDSPSSSGSIALLGNQPTHDAFLTQKLRESDAIIFGKAAMDEFAAGVSGISGGNGRIGNVYDTLKNSGGSSGGSAAAVSANFIMVSIGTDNSGSVRIPAAFNGIFGLRPSTGLVSQRGIFPRGNMDGIAGPLTRTVEDLAKVLDVIAQPDSMDKKTLQLPREKTYTAYLDKTALQGKRIGIVLKLAKVNTFKNMSPEVRSNFQSSIEKIQAMGVTIIPDIDLSNYNLESKFNQAGEREDVNAYLASSPAVRKDYYSICESERTRVFGSSMECMQFIREFPEKFGSQYNKASRIFKKNKLYIENIMNQYQLDALLLPVSATGSATYNVDAMINESLASNAGLPAIVINLGYIGINNLPIGGELIGRQFSEGILIGMAYAYEQQIRPRILPVIPEENVALEKLDIAQYNNLLMTIGYDTYKKVLVKSRPGKFSQSLTPKIFQEIVQKEIS